MAFYSIKILIFFSILLFASLNLFDIEEMEMLKEIKKALKILNITYSDSIDQKQFVKLFRQLIGDNQIKEGIPSSNIEDNFMFKVIRELLKGVPEKIKIEEIPKYLNPKRMEDIFNDLLGNMDFNEMLSEIGKEIDNSTEKIKKKNEKRGEKKNEKIKGYEENIDL